MKDPKKEISVRISFLTVHWWNYNKEVGALPSFPSLPFPKAGSQKKVGGPAYPALMVIPTLQRSSGNNTRRELGKIYIQSIIKCLKGYDNPSLRQHRACTHARTHARTHANFSGLLQIIHSTLFQATIGP
jgi:hypothetical protein